MNLFCIWNWFSISWKRYDYRQAAIAQLGERQTEDLKVPGSIPGLGISSFSFMLCMAMFLSSTRSSKQTHVKRTTFLPGD